MGAQEDWDLFSQVAESLGLEDKEREGFLSDSMKRKGHKPIVTWADNDEDDESSKGDYFSRGSTKSNKRDVKSSKRRSGADWQYDRD